MGRTTELATRVDGSACRAANNNNNRDNIIKMLKQQHLDGAALVHDPIFKEYRCAIKAREVKMRRKGWAEDAKPQIDDDLTAEGHARMMQLVADAASESQTPGVGVWARFGKPYEPLGRFAVVRPRP